MANNKKKKKKSAGMSVKQEIHRKYPGIKITEYGFITFKYHSNDPSTSEYLKNEETCIIDTLFDFYMSKAFTLDVDIKGYVDEQIDLMRHPEILGYNQGYDDISMIKSYIHEYKGIRPTDIADKHLSYILSDLNDIMKDAKEGTNLKFKFFTDANTTIYLSIYKFIRERSENSYSIILSAFDHGENVLDCHQFTIKDGKLHRTRPYFKGDINKVGSHFKSNDQLDAWYVLLYVYMARMLKMIRETYNGLGRPDWEYIMENSEFVKPVVCSDFELSIYKDLMGYLDKYPSELLYRYETLQYYSGPHYPLMDKYTDNFWDYFQSLDDDDSYYESIPIVKFSKNEWKYVGKYISEHGYIGFSGKVPNQVMDFRPYVSEDSNIIRNIRIPYMNKDGEETEVYFRLKYCKEGVKDNNPEVLFIAVAFKIPEYNVIINTRILFTDLEHFDCKNNIIRVFTYLHYKNYRNLMPSAEVLKNPCGLEGLDIMSVEDGMIRMIYEYLSLIILMHDRPERTKMVRETYSEDDESSDKSKNPNKNPKKEKNYVVRRILMTTSKARDYVKHKTGEHPDRQYVVETWERRAHDRHLKNGKIIHINAQKCKRHIPLTTKEVRIKL